jgi:hypothetical protein
MCPNGIPGHPFDRIVVPMVTGEMQIRELSPRQSEMGFKKRLRLNDLEIEILSKKDITIKKSAGGIF